MGSENPSALVTGASSGIGLAITRMLREEGFAITLVARRRDKLEAAAAELGDQGSPVFCVAADLADGEEVGHTVAAHRDRFGSLHVLVNNAGIGIAQPIGELGTRQLDLQLSVNLVAPLLFYRECAELLEAAAHKRGSALVINTSSITGKFGQAGLSVYSATKHGLIGLTQAMNRELGPRGVKSTALCPAFVDTAMTDYAKAAVPAESMLRPEDCAELVRALLRVSPACVVPELIMVRAEDRF